MRARTSFRLALLSVVAIVALGQEGTTMPSTDEIFELLAKASEKIRAFEEAVTIARSDLDKIDPKIARNYLDAASTAQGLVRTIRKNGPTGYGLVALLSAIDDLSLDAATASVTLLTATSDQRGNAAMPGKVLLLMTAKSSCNDISELLMHVTLRFIRVEEKILEALVDKK